MLFFSGRVGGCPCAETPAWNARPSAAKLNAPANPRCKCRMVASLFLIAGLHPTEAQGPTWRSIARDAVDYGLHIRHDWEAIMRHSLRRMSVTLGVLMVSSYPAFGQGFSTSITAPYRVTPNITYLTASNVEAKLDVYSRSDMT